MSNSAKKIRQAATKVLQQRKFTRVDALREFCLCRFTTRCKVCWKIMWKGRGALAKGDEKVI